MIQKRKKNKPDNGAILWCRDESTTLFTLYSALTGGELLQPKESPS